MKLVCEDEYGAYLGVSAQFLDRFAPKESNPNFEVFDSENNQTRFLAVKSSRLPDDQDPTGGRYGIDFHRAKPKLEEALKYAGELPHVLERRKWLANVAFAASSKEEYDKKSSIWESFYSYIWGLSAKTIWVAPHSGTVDRMPDEILPYPRLEIDAFTARLAATCAYRDRGSISKRIMISIHSNGYLGAVLDLGGFGIIDEGRLASVAEEIGNKYHEKVQVLGLQYKESLFRRITRWLEHIENKRGTLDPRELKHIAPLDRHDVENMAKGLKLYGQEINEFTLDEFTMVMKGLTKLEVQAVSTNHLFPAKQVGRFIELPEKLRNGLLHSALQVECSKLYLQKEPHLITDMVLDIKNSLFDNR
jgi:hypothetical protein